MTNKYLEQGNREFNRGKYFSAIEQYQKAIAENSKSFEAYYKKGLAEIEVQLYRDALDSFTRAGELNSNVVEIHYKKVFLHKMFREFELAQDSLKRANQLIQEGENSSWQAPVQKASASEIDTVTNPSEIVKTKPCTIGIKGLLPLIGVIFFFTRAIIGFSNSYKAFTTPETTLSNIETLTTSPKLNIDLEQIKLPGDIKITNTVALDNYYISNVYVDPQAELKKVTLEDKGANSQTVLEFNGQKYQTQGEENIEQKIVRELKLYFEDPFIGEFQEGTTVKVIDLKLKQRSHLNIPSFYSDVSHHFETFETPTLYLSYYDRQGNRIDVPKYLQRLQHAVLLDFLAINPESEVEALLVIPDNPEIAEVRISN